MGGKVTICIRDENFFFFFLTAFFLVMFGKRSFGHGRIITLSYITYNTYISFLSHTYIYYSTICTSVPGFISNNTSLL